MNLEPSAHSSPAQIARFRQFVAWQVPITFGFACVQTVAAATIGSPGGTALASVMWAFLGISLLARTQARRGQVTEASGILSTGLLVGSLLGAFAEPQLFPALAVVPLLAVAAIVPYRPIGELKRFIVLAWLVSAAVVVVGEKLPRRAETPDAYLRVFAPVLLAATLALALGLLFQFGHRLTEALAESQEVNSALQTALTEVRRADEHARVLAYQDPLTGLPNRLLFFDRLKVAVAQAHRQSSHLGVLFLDLDRFKIVNDSLGHATGDRLLREAAGRLAGAVRAGDTVARLGGDEFTLVLPGADGAAASHVAAKVQEALRLPFHLDGRDLFVTGSVGIGIYPRDGTDAETLLKSADIAMYRAKELGRDHVCLFASHMGSRASESLLDLESSLRRAVFNREITLHYQPVVDVATGRIRGVEGLARWPHPEIGLIWPADFIPLAEATGLINPLGTSLLTMACAQVRAWHREGHDHLRLAMNLAARQFQEPDLEGQVTRVLRETGFPARFLELEITESSAMQNAEVTVDTLRRLRSLGVRIAIDDFGVGYSSLGYLKRFPIDTLKIDQSFLREVDTDPQDAAIVEAVIAMAHSLRLGVVAEGVETEDQRRFLAERGCDQMQGYLFSHPVPAAECGDLLAGDKQQADWFGQAGARVLSWPTR